MTKKLEKPSPAQEARFQEFREKWLKIGLATEDYSTSDAQLRETVNALYAACELKSPRYVIRLASPMGLQLAANLVTKMGDFAGDQVGAQVRDQVGAQVGAQVRAQVWAQVRDQVRAQVRDQVGDQVWAQVWAQVRAQVGAQVRDQVWDQVRAQVGAQAVAQVGDQVWDHVVAQVRNQVGERNLQWFPPWYAAHEAGWHSWIDFFHEVCSIKVDTKKLRPLEDLTRACMWFIPFNGAFLCSERPLIIFRDSRNRLHHEGGPCLAWRDGYTVHALSGVRFEGELAKKFVDANRDAIDPEEVLAIKNAEQRSAVIRRIGVDKFVSLLPKKSLDKDNGYELLEIDIGTTKRRYLSMQNPSIDHVHIEAVAPECNTVKESLSWRNFGDAKREWIAPAVLT